MNICGRLGDRGFGCGGYIPEDLWRHIVLKRQLVRLVFSADAAKLFHPVLCYA